MAVWYDGASLRYAYNDHPTSGYDNGPAGGWKGNQVIFSDGGEHCAIKVDPYGGIHIAAYADLGLRYAYLPSYDATYNEETQSIPVDSYSMTGERITIDTGLAQVGDTTTYVVVPYISYFNGTARLPAIAHPVVKADMDYTAAGTGTADDDALYTGNWEVSIVPSPSAVTTNYYDKINIALWKLDKPVGPGGTTVKDVIVSSKDEDYGENVYNDSSQNYSYSASNISNGNIFGNGTKNPIMGYAVEAINGTYMETAQMR